jgi:hypothetical protein
LTDKTATKSNAALIAREGWAVSPASINLSNLATRSAGNAWMAVQYLTTEPYLISPSQWYSSLGAKIKKNKAFANVSDSDIETLAFNLFCFSMIYFGNRSKRNEDCGVGPLLCNENINIRSPIEIQGLWTWLSILTITNRSHNFDMVNCISMSSATMWKERYWSDLTVWFLGTSWYNCAVCGDTQNNTVVHNRGW